MPNILKIRLPASANEHSTIAQVSAERRATPRRSSFGEFAVTARNMGITANGSTRKNTEVIASSANSRTVVIEVGMRLDAETPRPSHSNIFFASADFGKMRSPAAELGLLIIIRSATPPWDPPASRAARG